MNIKIIKGTVTPELRNYTASTAYAEEGFKVCRKCSEVKPKEEFFVRKVSADGLTAKCKICEVEDSRERKARWYQKNSELTKQRARKWGEDNPEKVEGRLETWNKSHPEARLLRAKKWRQLNKEKAKEQGAVWRKSNVGLVNSYTAAYRAAKLQATPPWITPDDNEIMELVYAEAAHRKLHVDHIVPFQGENVCGLHVYWNTQLLSKSVNSAKGNLLCP